ncbi:MAG TPA: type II toxin-antitoxin system PemK/MazF family toxin [Candidatus Paceibacterota bacterium]
MEKNFDAWNEQKKAIESKSIEVFFKEGEIWWCSVGINIGNESCGKGGTFNRPVLVLRKLSRSSYVGIPISTQRKDGSWFSEILVNGELRYALLYQVRMFSSNRFQRRVGALEGGQFVSVKQKLEALLELCDHHQDSHPGSVGFPKA